MATNRYQKLFSDTVILALGTFGSKLLVFLLMPLYTAWLSPSEYGTAELISSTANLIMPFACMGITTGIFRFAAEKSADQRQVFSSGLAVVGGGFGILLLIGIPICLFGGLGEYPILVLLYVLFADLQAVCAQYVRGVDRTRLFAVQGIFNTLFTVLCNILLLVVFDLGVTGYVLSVILGNAATTLLLLFAARLWEVFSVSAIQKSCMLELLRFSLPMVPTTICWLITDLSDRYFVTAICGEAANGIYSAAYKIPTIVNLVSGIFMQAWQFSAVTQSANDEECRDFYSKVFRGFLSLIFIGTAGLILLSPLLCHLLLDPAYHEAKQYMPTLLCAVALESVVSFLATVYLVKKKSMHSFLSAIAGSLANLLLNALFIRQMGPLGAALATAISYALVYVIRMIDALRLIAFRLYLPRQIISFVLLSVAAGVMTFVGQGSLWICLGLTLILLGINFPALWQAACGLLKKNASKTGFSL